MKNHRDYLDEALKRNERDVKPEGDTLEFYRAIYGYQASRFAAYRALGLDAGWIRPGEMPVVKGESIAFPDTDLSALVVGLGLLLDELSGFHRGMNFDRLRSAFAEGAAAVDSAARALLARDFASLAAQAGDSAIGVEEYIFILVNWLKPYFAALAEKHGPGVSQEDWMESRCPVCGFYPDVAKIVGAKDGRRFLHCALCEFEWHFKRIACPVCDNEDTEKLGYFAVDGEPAYRVDYCDECKGYIKIVLLGKFQEPDRCDLTVENILTTDIDAAAMRKGYARP